MSADAYLRTPSGSRVDARWLPAVLSFGWLAFLPIGCLAGVAGASVDALLLALCGFSVALLGLVGTAVVAWILIFRVAKRLDGAVLAWYEDRPDAAVPLAQEGLRLAFRGDFRTKGFHVLGLCAEARADAAAALALFERAREALPAAAAPIRKARAKALIEAHRAISLCRLGRVDEAERAVVAAETALRETSGGVANALLDDASWGLGPGSINSVLESVERGRDARAVLTVARALVLRARGEHEAAIATANAAGEGLLPRERALLERLAADCVARQRGVHRAAPPPGADPAHVAWAEALLF